MARHRNVAREELQSYLAGLPEPKPKSPARRVRADALRAALAKTWATRLTEAVWRAMVTAEARRCVPTDEGNAVLREVDDAFELLGSYRTFTQARAVVALEHALSPDAMCRWDAVHEEHIEEPIGDRRRWLGRVATVRKELEARAAARAKEEAACPPVSTERKAS